MLAETAPERLAVFLRLYVVQALDSMSGRRGYNTVRKEARPSNTGFLRPDTLLLRRRRAMTTDTVSIPVSTDNLAPISSHWLRSVRDVSGSPVEMSDFFEAFVRRIDAVGEMIWESSQLPAHARTFGEMICDYCAEASHFSDLWLEKAQTIQRAQRRPTSHEVGDGGAEHNRSSAPKVVPPAGANEKNPLSQQLREALQAGVSPRCWSDLSTDANFDSPHMLPEAFGEFIRRVEMMAHYLQTPEIQDIHQPRATGRFLDELALEARRLMIVWRGNEISAEARRQLAELQAAVGARGEEA